MRWLAPTWVMPLCSCHQKNDFLESEPCKKTRGKSILQTWLVNNSCWWSIIVSESPQNREDHCLAVLQPSNQSWSFQQSGDLGCAPNMLSMVTLRFTYHYWNVGKSTVKNGCGKAISIKTCWLPIIPSGWWVGGYSWEHAPRSNRFSQLD